MYLCNKMTKSKNNKKSKSNNKSKNNNITIFHEYIEYHNKHIKKYGKKSLVLMQIGSFYECYSTDTDGPDLYEISTLLNITKTVKDKSNLTINYNNPYMLGFPMIAVEKYMPILVNNNYTVMVIDQVTPPPNPERGVVGIYSKCNYLDNIYTPESNFVACIYLEEVKQKNNKSLMLAGMSAVDLFNGKVYIHEAMSDNSDDKFAFDECNRFIIALQPKEIFIHVDSLIYNKKDFIIQYLELDKKFYHYSDDLTNKSSKKYSNLTFQNEVLSKSYENKKSMISMIEFLDLEKMLYATKSLVILIDVCSDHDANLINNLSTPQTFMNSKYVILGNNAPEQLNIIQSDTYESQGKIKSLLDIVNKASTCMGKRFIKSRLMSPLVNSNEIENIYQTVEHFLKDDYYVKVEEILGNIKDIDRIERKIGLLTVQPYEMFYFIDSIKNSYKLFKLLKKNTELEHLDSSVLCKKVKKMIKKCDKVFNYDVLKISNMTKEIQQSFFISGTDEEIDKLEKNMKSGEDILENIRSSLSNIIPDKNKKKNVQLKHNLTDGHYLYCTKKRGEYLEKYIKNNKNNKDNKDNKDNKNKVDFNMKELEFKYLKNACKISVPKLKNHSDDIALQTQLLSKQIVKVYKEFLTNFYSKYRKDIKKIVDAIINIDYYKTISRISHENHYVRPKIDDKNYGYIDATKLRHPIVEQIIEHEYIPHDIKVGNDLKGMLVYGLNSAGKSVLMKAVGLSIVLAQAGFYVPANSFTYSPYTAIYTRITGNDNIFKGLSSYALEMVELNSILKRSNKKTLVLGDEVCRGTEHISGNAIVATTIINLSKLQSTFIFATHLHEIIELDDIKELNNIKAFHLSVKYDNQTDTLVYDRQLREGDGERIYGITVAKSIICDKKFMDKAISIKNKLLDKHDGLISDKKSNYNSKKFVYECELCGKKKTKGVTNLETHHINFQKDFNNGYHSTKNHIKKNSKYNLLVVCGLCHDNIHSGEINVDSIKMTSKGKKVILNHIE